MSPNHTTAPNGKSEIETFKSLQAGLGPMFKRLEPDPLLPRTVVVVPSMTLDQDVLAKITGVHHYEERMLGLLMLLRMPRTRVIYITSEPIPESIIDYYLHLLPCVPHRHALRRLTLLSCDDASSQPLTKKILERPRLLRRIKEALGDRSSAHLACFNVSPLEQSLSVELSIPLYGCDPDLLPLGSKSGSRRLFREAGMKIADGYEDLKCKGDLVSALAKLKQSNPNLTKAVVKLNEGFSGEGNAIFRYDNAPSGDELEEFALNELSNLEFEAGDMTLEKYFEKFSEMGGIVEAFIEGVDKRSPSVQFCVDPRGKLEVVSTHDQVLGGNAAQVFLGCRFPADAEYRVEIQDEGLRGARKLAEQGVLGRFGIDFISVRNNGKWDHYAIEINLRKGGTTHPFIMLQYLTDGSYDTKTASFTTSDGRQRFYYATDNLESERYRGLTPDDLIDISVIHGIHFNGPTQTGVVFHLIGALSEFGKLGLVCVGDSPDAAERLYLDTVDILSRESLKPI